MLTAGQRQDVISSITRQTKSLRFSLIPKVFPIIGEQATPQ